MPFLNLWNLRNLWIFFPALLASWRLVFSPGRVYDHSMNETNNSQLSAVARFRDLHAAGCFVIPNPWDIGSAVYLCQDRI